MSVLSVCDIKGPFFATLQDPSNLLTFISCTRFSRLTHFLRMKTKVTPFVCHLLSALTLPHVSQMKKLSQGLKISLLYPFLHSFSPVPTRSGLQTHQSSEILSQQKGTWELISSPLPLHDLQGTSLCSSPLATSSHLPSAGQNSARMAECQAPSIPLGQDYLDLAHQVQL